MYDLPNTVKIGNIKYSLAFESQDELKNEVQRAFPDDDFKHDEILGRIEYSKELIALNRELGPSRMKEVLMHEIVHGLLYECGLDELNNEANVDALTHVIRRFLIENEGAEWLR